MHRLVVDVVMHGSQVAADRALVSWRLTLPRDPSVPFCASTLSTPAKSLPTQSRRSPPPLLGFLTLDTLIRAVEGSRSLCQVFIAKLCSSSFPSSFRVPGGNPTKGEIVHRVRRFVNTAKHERISSRDAAIPLRQLRHGNTTEQNRCHPRSQC
jgi:hypothetical protein